MAMNENVISCFSNEILLFVKGCFQVHEFDYNTRIQIYIHFRDFGLIFNLELGFVIKFCIIKLDYY